MAPQTLLDDNPVAPAPTVSAWPRVDPLAVLRVVALVAGLALIWWDLGGPRASFDESFTGVVARMPLGDIAPHLRAHDSHPPLDYLLRHPFASTGDTGMLRVPSAVFASLTLALVAWWLRDRGRFGVLAVAFTAVSTPHLLHAHSARPYALMILVGTFAAMQAERWLRSPDPRAERLMASALLLGLFDHSSGLLLAGGLLLVAGLRTDRAAWRWRAWVIAALGVWGALWGTAFVDQANGRHAEWIPRTDLDAVVRTLNGMTTMYDALAIVTIAALVVGGCLLRRRGGDELARVAACTALAPLVAAAAIGLTRPYLLSRTLAVGAWAVPVVLAALVDRALDLRVTRPTKLVVAPAAAILLVPSAVAAVRWEELSASARDALDAHVAPGDIVAVHPVWLGPVVRWDHPGTPTVVPPVLTDRYAEILQPVAGPATGRVWVLQPDSYGMDVRDLEPCGDATPDGSEYLVGCYEYER